MNLAFKQFFENLAQTNPNPIAIEVEKAKGIYIFDKNKNAYLDLVSGIAVNALGHSQPAIIKAAKKQLEKYMHVMVYGEYIQDSVSAFAAYLTSKLPPNLNMVYPVNSGTEANEAALKLAKRYTGKTKIISFYKSYHGSTHGSLSITGNENKKYAFRPLLPDVYFINLNNFEDLNQIDNKTACVILETIQGDAGVRIPTQTYLQALREKCNQTGTMLIFDEIQCGMGRTGKFCAFEHFNVVPDILTLGKALGAGLPIGALISSQKILSVLQHNPVLGHITTFGGNPVVCATALAGLEFLFSKNIINQVEEKGKLFESLLVNRHIKQIRRIGLMMAIEFDNAQIVQKIVENCRKNNVLTFWFLSCPESFRLAPPLTITKTEIKKACKLIQIAINEAFN